MSGGQVTPYEHFKCFEMQCRWEGYAPRGLPDTVDASYESLDYVETSSILRRYMDARTPQLWASERWMSMKRYLIVLIIGPLVVCHSEGPLPINARGSSTQHARST